MTQAAGYAFVRPIELAECRLTLKPGGVAIGKLEAKSRPRAEGGAHFFEIPPKDPGPGQDLRLVVSLTPPPPAPDRDEAKGTGIRTRISSAFEPSPAELIKSEKKISERLRRLRDSELNSQAAEPGPDEAGLERGMIEGRRAEAGKAAIEGQRRRITLVETQYELTVVLSVKSAGVDYRIASIGEPAAAPVPGGEAAPAAGAK